MNQNKFLLGGLVGGLAYFLFGALIYGFILGKTMESYQMAGVMKDPPAMLPLLIGNLAWGFMLAYIFERWARIRTVSGGAAAGTIIGFLMTAGTDFAMLGTSNVFSSYAGVLIDVIAGTVLGALVGGVIGWFLGYNRKD